MRRSARARSLTRQTLTRVALRFTIVAAVAAIISYYHVLHGLRTQALEKLEQYATQRGALESELFLLADDNVRTFGAHYARELSLLDETDPRGRFDELFVHDEEGSLRLRKAHFQAQSMTGFVGKYVAVDANLRRRLVLGFELLSRFGPAWGNRFVNLYLTTPESSVLMYWPGRPWGFDATPWEAQAKLLPAPSGEIRIIDDPAPPRVAMTWAPPYFDYAVSDWVVSAGLPIQVEGVHVASVSHDILLQDLIARTLEGWLPGTFNLVFAADGRLIAHPHLMDAIRAHGGHFSIPESGDAQLKRIFQLAKQEALDGAIIEAPEDDLYLAVSRLQRGPKWYLVTVFPEAIVAARAFETARLVLLLAVVALGLELLLLWLLFRNQIAGPLARLTGATARVAAGDYQLHLPEEPENEIGRLAHSFNRMSGEISQTMERLRETSVSRSYLDSIIQNSGEGIVTLDERGFIRSFNRAAERIFGLGAHEALGIHAMLLLADEAAAPFTEQDAYRDERDGPFAPSGSAHPIELMARRWDGKVFPMETVVTHTELEGAAQRICILRDVSERKQTETALQNAKEAAETANRAKSDFLANMSHELRTPLNSVLGYTQILQRQGDFSQKQRKSLAIIQHSGEHLLGLIEEVLDLAKIEAGTLELTTAPCELPQLVQSVEDALGEKARGKGLQLRVEQESDLPLRVLADERRLRQVLINLLDNAIKYTNQGRVMLRVCRADERLRFTVEDTGIGIAADQLSAVFENFHQVSESGAFREGAGLGLAICRRLVVLMGGELQVESSPGVGSRFWLDLALPATEVVAPRGTPNEPTLISVRAAGRRALIADDREDNRALLREILVAQGFKLREVGDGEACVRDALSWHPDVILVDLKMPVVCGEEAIRLIRESDCVHQPVLIAVSASVFGKDREQCLRAGADAFLPKPIQVDTLLALLYRHLELEPVFAIPEPKASECPAELGDAAAPPLPTERWQALSELARRGDVRGLREEAARLKLLDTHLCPLATQIGILADGFQVRRIRELLESTAHEP